MSEAEAPVDPVVAAVDRLTEAVQQASPVALAGAVNRLTAAVDPAPVPPPRIGRVSDLLPAGPIAASTAVFRYLLIAGVPIKRVPPEFYEEREDLILLTCRCRRSHEQLHRLRHRTLLRVGQCYQCDCGRIFLHDGRKMVAAHPPPPG